MNILFLSPKYCRKLLEYCFKWKRPCWLLAEQWGSRSLEYCPDKQDTPSSAGSIFPYFHMMISWIHFSIWWYYDMMLVLARKSKIHPPPLDPYFHISIWWYHDTIHISISWYYDMILALARTSKIHPPVDPYFHSYISWYDDTIHISRTKWSLRLSFIYMIDWLGGVKICVFCWGCLRILKGLNYEEVMLLQNSQITQSWWGVSHIYLT